MTKASDDRSSTVGLLAVILSCLVISELLREGLSTLELAATGVAVSALTAAEVLGRRRRSRPPSPLIEPAAQPGRPR